MRMTHLRFIVASCVFALTPLSAQAQEQPQTSQAGQATQQRDQDIPQRGDTLRDGQREQAGQRQQSGQRDQERGQTQQRGQQTQQRGQAGQREQDGQQIGQQRTGRIETGRIETEGSEQTRGLQGRAGAQQGQRGVENFLVQRLIHANKAEIELSQLATQEAQAQEVKEFAKKMIQDHQQLLQKLEQHASQQGSPQAGQQAGRQRAQAGQTAQTQPAQTQPGQTQPGQDQGEQRRPGQTRTGQDQPGQDQPGRAQIGQTQTGQGQPGQAGMRGQQVPQQLTQVVDQAAQKHLQMSKQMLQDADDFDKAYMGMAVVKHSMMVAELEAMQNVGSQEFQQLVSTAEDKTREHLEHAKKVMKKLDGSDRQATSAGRQASTRQAADQQQPSQRRAQPGDQPGAQQGDQPTRRGGQPGSRGTN